MNTANQALIERFVDEVGFMLERETGTPPMVGRVLGWLLVCDPPEQSAAELAARLQASKASISTATRSLLRLGTIERLRAPGERFDRFRVRPAAWDEFFWRQEQSSRARRVLRLGLDALADEPGPRRVRLEQLDAIYAWWEVRIARLKDEYLAERRALPGRAGANER